MPSEGASRRWRIARWACGVSVVVLLAVWIMNHFIPRPAGLGVRDGRLSGCPGSPNCVNSQSSDPRHHVDPIPLRGGAAATLSRLKDLLAALPGARVVEDRGDYLACEFRSRLWRFVDDVEFLADEAQGVIHVRSASRVGYWDLGANRRRVEWLRARLAGNEGPGAPGTGG